ncbi:hypothetical protein PH7735_00363 [Shimia thalassica]|uniref:Uncharacterized protein n=1 Tax=Shimia thalassica TaxID=1715693 RepID=A0A0N7M870_9RHOB|nr:hypothetical protein PH7735_00363 [Shimia thalassica]
MEEETSGFAEFAQDILGGNISISFQFCGKWQGHTDSNCGPTVLETYPRNLKPLIYWGFGSPDVTQVCPCNP